MIVNVVAVHKDRRRALLTLNFYSKVMAATARYKRKGSTAKRELVLVDAPYDWLPKEAKELVEMGYTLVVEVVENGAN